MAGDKQYKGAGNLINRRNLQKMSGWAAVLGEKHLDGIWELDIMNASYNGDFIEY